MPDLFTIPEFVSYLQVDDFDNLTATLARELATTEIRLAAGPAVYDSLADVSVFKSIALAVARRTVINPSGLRSQAAQIDDYSETNTYATESLGDAELTDAERSRIAQIVAQMLGRSSEAFTIRPSGSPDQLRYPWICR
ncbi:MAG: hypothetical protein ABW046_20565 [Actinoplanes sp.]